MKRTALKRKNPLKHSTSGGTINGSTSRPHSKSSSKGYKTPSWFNKLPTGSHGSTPAQKRLWKLLSDTYREQDWTEDPNCRACRKYLASWKDGHLGHFKKYSLCNSWFKFHRENLALICPHCNFTDDGPTQHSFGEYLIEKYGENHLEWIEAQNNALRGVKMKEWEIVDLASRVRPDLVKEYG